MGIFRRERFSLGGWEVAIRLVKYVCVGEGARSFRGEQSWWENIYNTKVTIYHFKCLVQ
jgi:hypothetical protein